MTAKKLFRHRKRRRLPPKRLHRLFPATRRPVALKPRARAQGKQTGAPAAQDVRLAHFSTPSTQTKPLVTSLSKKHHGLSSQPMCPKLPENAERATARTTSLESPATKPRAMGQGECAAPLERDSAACIALSRPVVAAITAPSGAPARPYSGLQV